MYQHFTALLFASPSHICRFRTQYHVYQRILINFLCLHQVAPGPCDESFGIQVAEYAQFPPEVVRLAKRKAEALEACTAAGGAAGGSSDNSRAVRRALEAFAALPLAELTPQQAFAETRQLFPATLAV